MSRVAFEDKRFYKRATSAAVGVSFEKDASNEDAIADLLEIVAWLRGEEPAVTETTPAYETYEDASGLVDHLEDDE